jgi:hypothetical protein
LYRNVLCLDGTSILPSLNLSFGVFTIAYWTFDSSHGSLWASLFNKLYGSIGIPLIHTYTCQQDVLQDDTSNSERDYTVNEATTKLLHMYMESAHESGRSTKLTSRSWSRSCLSEGSIVHKVRSRAVMKRVIWWG